MPRGVCLVVSDTNQGLIRAIGEVFQGVAALRGAPDARLLAHHGLLDAEAPRRAESLAGLQGQGRW